MHSEFEKATEEGKRHRTRDLLKKRSLKMEVERAIIAAQDQAIIITIKYTYRVVIYITTISLSVLVFRNDEC